MTFAQLLENINPKTTTLKDLQEFNEEIEFHGTTFENVSIEETNTHKFDIYSGRVGFTYWIE